MSPDSAQPTRRAANVLTIPSYWKMLDVPVAAVRPRLRITKGRGAAFITVSERPLNAIHRVAEDRVTFT